MQVVIEISEYSYIRMKQFHKHGMGSDAMDYILNGTILPKGHGRLIDADKCMSEIAKAVPYFINSDADSAYVEGLGRARIEIADAQTIIPEEKET